MERAFEGIIPPISSFFTPDFKIDKESYKIWQNDQTDGVHKNF